ncbi:hypothetical protein LCGC14_0349690 [marine sediment metagenome]|uniref:Uncharacterized protein n=1 Tax=marine sediment metagenome TaxID=412755 RepID=A0A0F9TU06_9ZZZZ
MELRNSKLTRLPITLDGQTLPRKLATPALVAKSNKFALNCFLGAVQMRVDDTEPWVDIKPHLVRDTDGWHIEGAPYYAEFKDNGTRLFCPDKFERSKYFKLPNAPLMFTLNKKVVSSPTQIDGQMLPNKIVIPLSDWADIIISFTNTGMRFNTLFKKAPPRGFAERFVLDAETAGLDIAELLKSKRGVGIPSPQLIEADESLLHPKRRRLDWSFKDGQLELGFDLSDMKFPILLKNATVDVEVDASGEDAQELESSGVVDIDDIAIVANSGDAASLRYWAGLVWDLGDTISSGDTIDTCYIRIYIYHDAKDDANLNLHIEELAAPVDFTTTGSDITGRDRTEASVSWIADGIRGGVSGYKNSPSLVTPMQEVTDAYSSTRVAVLTRPNTDVEKVLNFWAWDDGTSLGAQLYVEWSAAAVGGGRGWAQK